MTIMPCGPPKPRNAVFDCRLVLATRPWTSMSGIQYALSMWHRARASTGSDRSRLQPPLLVSVARSAHSRLPASKPASQVAKNGCRLPVIVMSWVRLSRRLTGCPVSVAPSAAMAASPCGWNSLPPKPPPMRRHCTVTWCAGTPSTWATMSWVSVGCCVLDWTKIWPLESTRASAAWVSR